MVPDYLSIPGYAGNPAFSEVAVLPPGASWVWIGVQNAVTADRQIVGKGDPAAQAQAVKTRLDAALVAAGCTWSDVVRVTVHVVTGTDLRAMFAAFQPALAGRTSPPLVGVYQVAALAHPDFLLEVGLEAVRP